MAGMNQGHLQQRLADEAVSTIRRHYSGEDALYPRDTSRPWFGYLNLDFLFGWFGQLALCVVYTLELPRAHPRRGLVEGTTAKRL